MFKQLQRELPKEADILLLDDGDQSVKPSMQIYRELHEVKISQMHLGVP